ncbi:hypothetical protein IPZ70_22585 [Streptomyces polychromogenes]|nr:hypothetical protein [Streptomyces polychromogenes]
MRARCFSLVRAILPRAVPAGLGMGGRQAATRRLPAGVVRLIGGILAACGLVAVPASLVMMTRG